MVLTREWVFTAVAGCTVHLFSRDVGVIPEPKRSRVPLSCRDPHHPRNASGSAVTSNGRSSGFASRQPRALLKFEYYLSFAIWVSVLPIGCTDD